jgi:UDP-4-amino-4,6-dideoxy-N-acetyl-beta-L-altrosamine transaminase
MIPYGHQDIRAEDIDAVIDVLKSDFITQGPAVPRFEDAVARYCGTAHAIAVSSATAALHIACLAVGLRPGDWLWTSPNTFVASANCARYCGANVDFVDIDPLTYNMASEALVAKLKSAQRENRLPKVVMPVHFGGQSCDMVAIRELGERYNFRIIEDASHAIGGRYLGKPVGSCLYSDIAVFSFHPVKIITTAEGGMALTNDGSLAAKMQRLRSHGTTRDPALMNRGGEGPWFYQQLDLGFNYRLTDIQAALGFSQLKRVDSYVARRHELARTYDQRIVNVHVTPPYQHPDCYSALHLYPVWIDPEEYSRAEVFKAMRDRGIGVNVHYIPVHTQPYYSSLGFCRGQFPNAERYYAGAISLPIFPTMTADQLTSVVEALKSALFRRA